MKSILYLQHVGWGWIKQRPHFIAENLSHWFRVDVYTERSRHSHWSMEPSKDLNLKIHTFIGLPLRRFRFIRAINCVLAQYQLTWKLKDYDLVWVTHPSVFNYIKKTLPPSTRLVYDCMDDVLAFPATQDDPNLLALISQNEAELINRANNILVSSKSLEQKVLKRGGDASKIKIINNAMNCFDPNIEPSEELPESFTEAFEKPGIKLLYLGTISDWFDFSLVISALNLYPEVRCFLVGPSEIPIPEHERLHHLGPIEHRLVMPLLGRADLLIMPFLLNELVLSVDPVKLYEYIASGRPVLALAYPETEKFKTYAHLYYNQNEFFEIINKICLGEDLSLMKHHDIPNYINKNSWSSRSKEIFSILGF